LDNKNIIKTELNVNNNEVTVIRNGKEDYISLTDLARYKNADNPSSVITHWLSTKDTVDFIGLWEELTNPSFNSTEFRIIKTNESGYKSFTITPTQ
jgi:hypothetical protein